MNHTHIISLVSFNANLQVAHWQADTYGNTHKTLGELYEQMTDLTDTLAEVAFGKDGNTDFAAETIQITPRANLGELLKAGKLIIDAIYAELGEGDDDLENILADMCIAINRAKYLLKV